MWKTLEKLKSKEVNLFYFNILVTKSEDLSGNLG